MLKLTNSFYRYLAFSCENIHKAHVRRFTHFRCNGRTRSLKCVDIRLIAQFHSSPLWRQHGQDKKRSNINIPPVHSNVFIKPEPMSHPSQSSTHPTTNHASIGGQFQVIDDPLEAWRREMGQAEPFNDERKPSAGVARRATIGDSRTASAGESRRAPAGESRRTSAGEVRRASHSEGRRASTGDRSRDNSDDRSREYSDEFRRDSCEDIMAAGSEVPDVPPNFRVWEDVVMPQDHRQGDTYRFKVLSYNVLAQYLLECHPYLYTDCKARNLKWKVRAARLYDEIMQLQPDILCFQEVQTSHLQTFYAKFERIGYCGIFKRKTGFRHDGCAIYFKQSLFQLTDHLCVEFCQPDLPILNRDNIGLMVKLAPRWLPNSAFVVATTHLLYNPKRTDVRLAQMQVFLAEIDRFAYFDNGKQSGHLPIIMTGDLNSTPDSAVIQLLDRGHVCVSPYRDSSDWKRIGVTDNCQHLSVYLNRQAGRDTEFSNLQIYNSDYSEEKGEAGHREVPSLEHHTAMFNSGVIGHSLRLSSVYNRHKFDGLSVATTYQDYWVTVDYIYFSKLKLVNRLRLPTVAECSVLGRLPNNVYGSDHLALAATFELKNIYNDTQ